MGQTSGRDGNASVTGHIERRFNRTMLRLVFAFSVLSASACAQEPDTANLTAITFNYSEAYSLLRVNGEWAGKGSNSVKPGDVTGGGGICCIDIPTGAKTAMVEVQTGVDDKYMTEARIEQPWPDFMHYAAIHILPGRKVVISIMGSSPAPRIDLLDRALKDVGVEDYTIEAPYAWDSGPEKQL